MDDTIISAFAEALHGGDAVAINEATLAENAKDYWGFGRQPGLVLRPRSRDDVVAAVKVAAEQSVSLVTRAGASNCSAGVMAGADRGPHALKYGVTYNHVLGVEAVLADGTVVNLNAESTNTALTTASWAAYPKRCTCGPLRPCWRVP